MRRQTRTYRWAGALVALTLVAAACGSDDDSSDSGDTTEDTTEDTTDGTTAGGGEVARATVRRSPSPSSRAAWAMNSNSRRLRPPGTRS